MYQEKDNALNLSFDPRTGLIQLQTLNGGVPIEHFVKIIQRLNLLRQKSLARSSPSACIS